MCKIQRKKFLIPVNFFIPIELQKITSLFYCLASPLIHACLPATYYPLVQERMLWQKNKDEKN